MASCIGSKIFLLVIYSWEEVIDMKLYKAKIKYFYRNNFMYIKETTHVAANTLEEAITKIHSKYDFKDSYSFQFRPTFIIKIKEM